MGSQRVGHNWATKLNWLLQELIVLTCKDYLQVIFQKNILNDGQPNRKVDSDIPKSLPLSSQQPPPPSSPTCSSCQKLPPIIKPQRSRCWLSWPHLHLHQEYTNNHSLQDLRGSPRGCPGQVFVPNKIDEQEQIDPVLVAVVSGLREMGTYLSPARTSHQLLNKPFQPNPRFRCRITSLDFFFQNTSHLAACSILTTTTPASAFMTSTPVST